MERHQDRVLGTLSGFDRVLFRGTLRTISYVQGAEGFLRAKSILHKDFLPFAKACTDELVVFRHLPVRHLKAVPEAVSERLIHVLRLNPVPDGREPVAFGKPLQVSSSLLTFVRAVGGLIDVPCPIAVRQVNHTSTSNSSKFSRQSGFPTSSRGNHPLCLQHI